MNKHCSLVIFVETCLLNKRVKIFLNYFIGPVLFIWVSISLYRAVQQQADLHQSWEMIKASVAGPNQLKLVAVLLLMLVNWGIEARKWQVLVHSIEKISLLKAFKAVFSGQSLAVNTPNRVGEFVGRVVYLDNGHRLKGIALTIVGSMSQTIVTLFAGLVGLFVMKETMTGAIRNILAKVGFLHRFAGFSHIAYEIIFYGVLFTVALLIVVYFELSWLVRILDRLPFVHRYSYLIEKLEGMHWRELTRILSLSVSRYVVFVVQFILLLQVFEVVIPFWQAAALVSVFFLVLAVVPTISSIELSLRGLAAAELFGLFSSNALGIIATTAGIWLLNLIIPALAGSLFILGVKLYKK